LIENVCLKILVEDAVGAEGKSVRLIARHGLSIVVEAKAKDVDICVLMDVGPSAEALVNNVDVVGVNLRKIDAIMLSHGHYDHVDGLIPLLKAVGKSTPIFAHPKAFQPKFSLNKKLRFVGASYTPANIRGAGGIPVLTVDAVKIADGIMTTGEIARVSAYEKPKGFLTLENGRFVEDAFADDQALIINLRDKGLVIVTGCAHAGIVNTIIHAQKIMNTRKVYAVLGGFHLVDAANQRVRSTVEALEEFNPQFLGPCHCTGKRAIRKLVEAFGDKCHQLKTGDSVEF
jgi:7,8-dihydropterin-6-yl-methyl-4-(beta-D-ribofuranosyl)aminobenzene 5'-phosphate synthase